MKKELCFGTIPIQNNRVFLVLHKKGEYWGLPKGHLEAKESPEQAAQRELEEETSLYWKQKLVNHPFVETYRFMRDGEFIEKKVEYFLVEVEGDARVDCADVIEGDWFSWKEAIQKASFEGNQKILEEAFKLLHP